MVSDWREELVLIKTENILDWGGEEYSYNTTIAW